MKNGTFILLLQLLVFSGYSQDKSLSSFINSRVVNKEGVVQHITFKNTEKPNFKNGVTVLKQFLETSNGITFVKLKSRVDKIGMAHEKYKQHYNGIPVEFGIYKVHSKNQILSSINGEFYPIKEINTTPFIAALEAVSKAKQHVNAEKYMEESGIHHNHNMDYKGPNPTLTILPKIEGINKIDRLVYKLDIYATKPLYRADVYIDAQTGAFIFENSKIQHADVPASGVTLYNGQQNFTAENIGGIYRLQQTTQGNGIQTFDMNNATDYANNAQDVTSTTANFTSNQDAVQVHWGTEQTYEYYLQRHGRNSFDNNGAILKSYVNYGGSNIPNAFWNGSGMSYNNATNSTVNELVAIDIVGHEITHGVVQHSAGLIYSYQSGALNESFADIFGEMTENFAQQGVNDWLAGSHAYVAPNEASRSLSDPKSKNDPDTYLGQYWHTSSSDRFGVHVNSGVQNKWFYLLSEGGTGTNDNNDSYAITGIGMIKAAAIAYRNLTVYLTPTANFFDARAGAIQAATDLYGAGSLEVQSTTDAWNAVGVTSSSSDIIPPTIPLNVVSSNVTPYNIELTWDASTDNIGVVGYNIYKGVTLIGTTNSPDYNNGNLPMPINTIHDFTVAAVDAAGNISGFSNVESVWIDTIEPSDPTNLMSSNTTETTTDLSWDTSTDNFSVIGYNIYQNNTLLTTVANTTYNVTGLTPNSTYTYRVTALDDSGNESGIIGISNGETVTTLATCATNNVTLTINLDMYPEEISWDIKNDANIVVASGGNYSSMDANTTVNYNITLETGYFTLNIHDTFGDGLIPPGGYVLESNVVIASNGPYGASANTFSHPFCISKYWTGTTDTDWNTTTNWNPNGIPLSSDNIIIPDITNKPVIGITTAAVTNNLTVDTASSLTIENGGSLIVDGTAIGNVTYNRAINFVSGNANGWYLMASPLAGEIYDDTYISNNNIAISGTNRGLATYNTALNSWEYSQIGDNETFTSGQGYSIKKGTSTGNVSFNGTINTDNAGVNITLATTGNRFNLLGNPYTAYLNSATFLTNESAISDTKTLWVWNQTLGTNGAYEVKIILDAFSVAPNQGFFVKANATGGIFNFSEANQSHNGTDTFQKTTNKGFKLTISSGTIKNYTKIYYLENATTGFDVGYDGELFGGTSNSFAVYSHLVANSQGKNYQTQSLPNINYENMIIPLGLNVEANKEILFAIEDLNLPSGIKVFLEDKETNTFTRLDLANSSYTINTIAALNGIGRFYLHTSESSLHIKDVLLEDVSIYKTNASTIRVVGLDNIKTDITIFNILGKQLYTHTFTSNGTKDFSLSKFATGIYIVKLQTNKGEFIKKIIME